MTWMRHFSLSTLERRVFLVAVASLIPVAILSFALLVASARAQEERLYRGAEDTIFALLNAVDAELKSHISALDALAVSPRLARGDFALLREEALQLLERRPSWLNVVVADAQFQRMNARLPDATELPAVVSPETVAETLQTRRPVIGSVLFAPLMRKHTFAVQIPYERASGEERLVITAVVRPESLLDLINLERVADQGVIALLDRTDRVVARTRNHAATVGKLPSGELIRLIHSSQDRGRGITHTIEGVPVYTVFRRSAYSGWAAAFGIPQESIDGPMRRSYLILGGSIAVSILLGLGLALFVGRAIVRPMRELEESATRVGRGEAPGMPTTRLPEVRRIAVALSAAHSEREALLQGERDARVAAEKASKAKDEFLAMLGHELRNPLAAISNASHLIERQRDSLDPQLAAATGIIGRQTRHLARLTDDLLDAGRVILGKVSLVRSPVELAASVRTTIESLRSTGRIAEHELHAMLDPVWIYADPTRIDQIVSNLLTNAFKYTPAGGSITVSTRQEGQTAILCVSDTGIGLEPELLPRVFELFVQGERALDRAQGGLGIGLTLVHRLAELHQGDVAAQSPGSGGGSTFTVRLPSIDAPTVATTSAPAPAAHKRVVALVEDNPDARESLRMLLEIEGHVVHAAADGAAGVALLEEHPAIEIAFVDIGLPGMNGFAVAQAARRLRGTSLRLVAMSGYGADQDVARGIDAGFDSYVVKPADFAKVQAEIAKVSGNTPTSP